MPQTINRNHVFMDLYQEFLKEFKISLTNSTFYAPTHPAFIASITEFQRKIQKLIGSKESIYLKIKPTSLFVDDKEFQEDAFCRDLAETIHLKKIKTIQILRDVSIQELSIFILGISLNKDLILKEGGLKKILELRQVKKILVEPLDYSKLVQGQGDKVEDAWAYLLNPDNAEKEIMSPHILVEKIKKALTDYDLRELLQNQERADHFIKILSRLKEKDQGLFKEILLTLSQVMLKTKNCSYVENAESFQAILSNLSATDVKELIFSIIKDDQAIDPLAFEFFSSFIDQKTHEAATDMIGAEILKNYDVIDMDIVRKLFSSLTDQSIAPLYRKKLFFLESQRKQDFILDYTHLYENYRLILLDMFLQEKNIRRLSLIIEKISQHLQEPSFSNAEYLDKFKEIYDQKVLDPDVGTKLKETTHMIWSYAEKNHFNSSDFETFNYLLDVLPESTLDEQYYFDKVFHEGIYNKLSIKLFFRFFSEYILEFCSYVQSKAKDRDFLERLSGLLLDIDDHQGFDVLKSIFDISSLPAKVNLLECFKKISIKDKDFFIGLLKNENSTLRKKSLEIILSFGSKNKEAVKVLFSMYYFLSFKNDVVLENLEILEDLYLPEAKPYLMRMSKDILFWNHKLKQKAKRVLKKYNDRTN